MVVHFRYYILGFNFNEKVRVNRESCQLLLERVGLENWALGKSKVCTTTFVFHFASVNIENE